MKNTNKDTQQPTSQSTVMMTVTKQPISNVYLP